MSIVDQAGEPLERPVLVWVLNATPRKVRSGGDGEDHLGELIATLRQMPSSLPSRRASIDALTHKGFSAGVAQWMTTNLKATTGEVRGDSSGYKWVFDLEGIADMYKSDEDTNLWSLVDNVPE